MSDPSAIITAVQTLLSMGPTGILAFVVWILWREVKAEREKHFATLKTHVDATAKMIGDYQEFTEVIKDLTEAIYQRGPHAPHR